MDGMNLKERINAGEFYVTDISETILGAGNVVNDEAFHKYRHAAESKRALFFIAALEDVGLLGHSCAGLAIDKACELAGNGEYSSILFHLEGIAGLVLRDFIHERDGTSWGANWWDDFNKERERRGV